MKVYILVLVHLLLLSIKLFINSRMWILLRLSILFVLHFSRNTLFSKIRILWTIAFLHMSAFVLYSAARQYPSTSPTAVRALLPRLWNWHIHYCAPYGRPLHTWYYFCDYQLHGKCRFDVGRAGTVAVLLTFHQNANVCGPVLPWSLLFA